MLTTVVNSIKAPAELAEVISLWVAHEDSNECVISLHNNWDLIANRKQHAVSKLERYFKEGSDFLRKKSLVMVGRARNVEQEVTDYLMTAHTFKELCMILNNDKSKNVRSYLIAAEIYGINIPQGERIRMVIEATSQPQFYFNEATYRDYLNEQFGGTTEYLVNCSKERADIVTSRYLIEVKPSNKAHSAVNQVLHYNMLLTRYSCSMYFAT